MKWIDMLTIHEYYGILPFDIFHRTMAHIRIFSALIHDYAILSTTVRIWALEIQTKLFTTLMGNFPTPTTKINQLCMTLMGHIGTSKYSRYVCKLHIVDFLSRISILLLNKFQIGLRFLWGFWKKMCVKMNVSKYVVTIISYMKTFLSNVYMFPH